MSLHSLGRVYTPEPKPAPGFIRCAATSYGPARIPCTNHTVHGPIGGHLFVAPHTQDRHETQDGEVQ